MEIDGPDRISLSLKTKDAAFILLLLEKSREQFRDNLPPEGVQQFDSLIGDIQKQMGKQYRRFHERTGLRRWN